MKHAKTVCIDSLLLSIVFSLLMVTPMVFGDDEMNSSSMGNDLLFFSGEDLFVVSASRFAERANEAPAIIEVISAKEIDRSGARTIAELLRWRAGWHFIMGRDSKSLPYVRGLGSRHPNKVLVLVDGTPYKDGFYQDFIYDEYFPLEIVERIEVIRGPGSALYGSNALTGVINIITKKGSDFKDKSGSLNFRGGSRQTLYLTAQGGGETEHGYFVSHVRVFQSDNQGPDYSQRGYNNIDESGFRKKALSAHFNYNYQGFYLKTHVIDYFTPQIAETDRSYFGNNGGWSRYNVMSEAGVSHALSDSVNFSAKLYWQYYNNNSRWGSALPPWEEEPVYIQNDVTTKTERWGGGMQVEWGISDNHKIIAGMDYELNRIIEKRDLAYDSEWDNDPDVTLYAPPSSVYEGGFYLQDTLHLWKNMLGVTLGARFTENELFGSFFTPRGGIVISPLRLLSVKLLYGEAYRSPNGRELFTDPNGDWTAGNEELEPEQINTVEGQFILRPLNQLDVTFTLCRVKTKNDIEEAEEASVPSGRQWKNLEGTETQGGELTAQYQSSRFSIFSNVSLYEIKDLATDERKKFVPQVMWNLGLSVNIAENLQVMALWNHIGNRKKTDMTRDYFDEKQNSGAFDSTISYEDATMGGKPYNVVDMTLTWKNPMQQKFVKGAISVFNLLDEQYSDFPIDPGDEGKKLDAGYKHPGRAFLVSLLFHF